MFLLLYRILYKKRISKLILIGVIFPVLVSLIICILSIYFPGIFLSGNDFYDPLSLIKENPWLLAEIVLLAPLLETPIQYIPLKISSFFFSKYTYISWITILTSGIFFGVLHRDGLLYLLSLSFAGIVWAFICFVLIRRKSYPYPRIVLIHCLYNSLILALDYIYTLFVPTE